MHFRDVAVKKYVVRLSMEERHYLEELIRKGKHPSQRLTKARILLKADVGEAGEGWSDSRDHRGTWDQHVDGLPRAQTAGGRGF